MAGTITATTIQNDTSSPPAFRNNTVEIGRLCRAWVNYNGVAQTVTGSFNVSSVTYNSTGIYTVNFTTAMPNALYATLVSGARGTANDDFRSGVKQGGTYSTTAVQVFSGVASSGGTYVDSNPLNVSVFSS